ncbi:MAG: DUF2878 family protein [Planctomycetes bacterium]|nr:DUF2878 family protein [Planctomycetota bacterium]
MARALCVLAWCAWHVRRSPRRGHAARALAGVALLGTLADTLLLQAGWIEYRGTPLAGVFAPAWIAALWAAFATSFESTFAWVARDLRLAALLGALASPASYWAGERLGALDLGTPRALALSGIASVWAAALPLAILLQRRLR